MDCSLFLLEGFGPAFAEVFEVNETDSMRFEEILGCSALRSEPSTMGRGWGWCP